MKAILFLFCGALLVLSATCKAHNTDAQTLASAFSTCYDLPSNSLASALLHSAWDVKTRADFELKHPEARHLTVTQREGATELVAATVSLMRPPSIAGLRPIKLSAGTCSTACDYTVWSLEFGSVNAAGVARLKAWAKGAAAAVTNPDYLPVEVLVNDRGEVSLYCNLSG